MNVNESECECKLSCIFQVFELFSLLPLCTGVRQDLVTSLLGMFTESKDYISGHAQPHPSVMLVVRGETDLKLSIKHYGSALC